MSISSTRAFGGVKQWPYGLSVVVLYKKSGVLSAYNAPIFSYLVRIGRVGCHICGIFMYLIKEERRFKQGGKGSLRNVDMGVDVEGVYELELKSEMK